jgi:adenylate cyclase
MRFVAGRVVCTSLIQGHPVVRVIRRRAVQALHAIGLNRIRLVSGLTLFIYVGMHLTNHALGNISVSAMEAGLVVQKFIWQGLLGTCALYLALTVHFLLGLWALYQRRHYGWARGEVLQLILGLSIPPLLAHHLIVTRIDYALFGTEKGYAQELYAFWVATPRWGAVQVTLLTVVWIHGCIGIHYWLRLKSVFQRIAPPLLGFAVSLPVLALLGFVQGGKAIGEAAPTPAWRAINLTPGQVGTPVENVWLALLHQQVLLALAILLALVLAARGARKLLERLHGSIQLFYPHGKTVRVPRGFSVLEASLMARVPHACICGGRARCSTCRVRVLGDKSALPAPSELEQIVLQRVHAGPFVRLACQLRPVTDTAIVPLLPANMSTTELHNRATVLGSEERFVAVLMIDMRDSTQLALRRLPFDAVFAIGNFVDEISRAVVAAGGQPNQFLGDGLLAIFGLDCGAAEACRRALSAISGIAANIAGLNEIFGREWIEPIRFGIGLHGGEAIVGGITYGDMTVFTALGDPVNVAARLQEHCKALECEAVISDDVCCRAELATDDLPRHIIELRGRDQPIAVRIVARAVELAQWVGRPRR